MDEVTCTHSKAVEFTYGAARCGCGAVRGIDGRWRIIRHDPDTLKVTVAAPDGQCPHPFLRRHAGRLRCGSCGLDHGPVPVNPDLNRR